MDTALLGRLIPGDHVCWLVGDDDTRADGTAAYVRAGLAKHHKVFCYGDEPEQIIAGLEARGVHTAAAIGSGQLRVTTAAATYQTGGAFDAAATVRSFQQISARVRAEGYRGLRAIGDMSWASRPVPGAGRVPWYEAQVNRVLTDGFAIGVCIYDPRRFGPAALRELVSAHPGLMSSDSGAGPVPLLHAIRTGPLRLRLEGEADLSNRRALAAMVGHLVEDATGAGREVTIEVGDLRFADGESARILVGAASHPGGLRIVGSSPALRRVLTFHGAGTRPGLTLA